MISKQRKNELQKQYYQRHKDYYEAYRKAYYLKHKEAICDNEREKRKARREAKLLLSKLD